MFKKIGRCLAVAVVAGVGAVCFAASPASAAGITSVSVVNGDMTVVDWGDNNNNLLIGPGVVYSQTPLTTLSPNCKLVGAPPNEGLWRVTCTGHSDETVVHGGLGNDTINIVSSLGGVAVWGGEHNDTIWVQGTAFAYVWGDKANDTGADGADTITVLAPSIVNGGNNADNIRTGYFKDYVFGGGGNDTIRTDGGEDYLYGDGGNDTLTGGNGPDNLFGGADNDHLMGKQGRDTLTGDSGNDILEGNDDNDRFIALDGYFDILECGRDGNPDTVVSADSFDQRNFC